MTYKRDLQKRPTKRGCLLCRVLVVKCYNCFVIAHWQFQRVVIYMTYKRDLQKTHIYYILSKEIYTRHICYKRALQKRPTKDRYLLHTFCWPHTTYPLQHSATHCSEVQTATPYNTLLHAVKRGRIHDNTLQHTATLCNTLQHSVNQGHTHYNTMLHTATHCNTLQHTATHCNTQ